MASSSTDQHVKLALSLGNRGLGEQTLVGDWRSRLATVLALLTDGQIAQTMSKWILRIPNSEQHLSVVDEEVRAYLDLGHDGLNDLRHYKARVARNFTIGGQLAELTGSAVDHYVGCAIALLDSDETMLRWHAGLVGTYCLALSRNYIPEYDHQVGDLISILTAGNSKVDPPTWPNTKPEVKHPNFLKVSASLGDPDARPVTATVHHVYGSYKERLTGLLGGAMPHEVVSWASRELVQMHDQFSSDLESTSALQSALRCIANFESNRPVVGDLGELADEVSLQVCEKDDGATDLPVRVLRMLHFGEAISGCLLAIAALNAEEHQEACEYSAAVASELAKAAPSELAELKRQIRSMWAG